MEIEVYYMSGAGNLFTFLDNRKYCLSNDFLSSISPFLCGNEGNEKITDGLVALSASADCDFQVDFFNPDGSFGALCGNGARCAIRFAERFFDLKKEKNVCFSQLNEKYFGDILDKTIKVYLPAPKQIIKEIAFEIFNQKITGTFLDVGARHIVINYEEIKNFFISNNFHTFDLNKIAVPIRNMYLFSPLGVNVNIYREIADSQSELRTFEKGVERETAACGTGAISTALTSNLHSCAKFPIEVIPKSRSVLKIDLLLNEEKSISKISLEGEAVFLNSKQIVINYGR